MPPGIAAGTAAEGLQQFAGGLGMDLAAAMADNTAMVPENSRASRQSQGTHSHGSMQQSDSQSIGWPDAHGLESQITGFAVASPKRNADFHAIFQAVGEDDYLIEGAYSSARIWSQAGY